ncbi:MAG: radical SAM family heme chaperone HemW [bacterium]|nr:radical SAM family heme chaperone HemW [bacterium]
MSRIALYIHIPFCIKKCLYCDFHSFRFDLSLIHQYTLALIKELELRLNKGSMIKSIYLGGGTPSILPVEDLEKIVDTIYKSANLEESLEFTIEVNPGTINMDKLRFYRNLGINRISIGVQSLVDEELRTLGRIHSSKEALDALDISVKVGFENISVDLIYGIPNQTIESWGKTLESVLKRGLTHISIYGLIYEPGTPLYKFLNRGMVNPMPESLELEIFNITQEVLDRYGFFWYEISNYAKDGYECRHNLTYWKGEDYLGFGPSAHSLIGNVRNSNTPNIKAYVELVNRGKSPKIWEDRLSPFEKAKELVILGLRLREGVSISEVYMKTGIDIGKIFSQNIEKLVFQQLIYRQDDRIALTDKGRLLGNLVFGEFL